ncbi:GTPase [Photobacterium toruni]|uniref:GTPase YlqF n=1 Tax=Photobacterium toruni TaxID=1935446 RepID=A0A1T4UGX0_9GAMM|nr:GTPase [Photobacterium toruni]SKA51907.1 GTPase YlqF [Photobacterium toruni]
MFNAFSSLESMYRDVRPLLVDWVSSAAVTNFDNELAERQAKPSPKVMVYGVYNAGKSTLINALAGKALARCDDIPTTDAVTAYSLGDIELLDTPGIDAPIEHEVISREQLEKSDVVVFVIGSRGVLEEKQTYCEIERILDKNKTLVFVLNAFDGQSEADSDIIAIRQRFLNYLRLHLSEQPALLTRLDRCHHFMINAQLAFMAKQSGDQALLAFSGIEPLERQLIAVIQQTDQQQMARTLAYQFNGLLQQAQQSVSASLNDEALTHLAQLIQAIEQKQAAVQTHLLHHCDKSKGYLKAQYQQAMVCGDQERAQALTAQWQGELNDKIVTEVHACATQLEQQMEVLIQQFDVDISWQRDGLADNDASLGDTIFDSLKEVVKQQGGKQLLSDELVKYSVIKVLKQGKAWFPELFKGIGKRSMEKIGQRVVPFVGPAIDVVTGIWDYRKACVEEQKARYAEQQHQIALEQQAIKLTDNVIDAGRKAVVSVVDECFTPLLATLQQQAQGLHTTDEALDDHCQHLHRIQQQLKPLLNA